ncbi:hypothetical protein AX774_g1059 [Zancudomyces culisetae]|uniref:Uncharacterized protein n=1 Tax=Zancudomyces culisetae TaxID=1213189 RepID=A0A1R1PWW4_ZANCU|nr:hypothetical protein AX774_g1059 [Zancudomyces culisetae]|eukprot:OMH85392.1 hypothetical protein AX774_g1059 [Zancudomyces culisetae]
MDLHQGTEARRQVCEDEGDTFDSLSRRFAHVGRVEEPVYQKRGDGLQRTVKGGFFSQGIKVLTNPKSIPGPSGFDYKHQRDELEGPKNQAPRPKEGGREVSQ